MGQHISNADLDELERSLARNQGSKKFFYVTMFYYYTSTRSLRFNECWSMNT